MTSLLSTLASIVITVVVVPFALVAIVLRVVGEVCTWASQWLAAGVMAAFRVGRW